ncbi:MAG: hypothetical protein WCR56_04935 [Bacilli bacterium]|jgi:hypothetical protein
MKTKIKSVALLSLAALSLVSLMGCDSKTASVSDNNVKTAVTNEKGRSIVQTKEITGAKVGDVIDISNYVEVIHGALEDNDSYADRSYTLDIYSEDRGVVLEKTYDGKKIHQERYQVTCVAPGRATVEIKSQGATLMISFDVAKDETETKISDLLGKVTNQNLIVSQPYYDSQGNLEGETRSYHIQNASYSEFSGQGYYYTDSTYYDISAKDSKTTPTFTVNALVTGSAFKNTLQDVNQLNLRKLRYYPQYKQAGYAFDYAYIPGSTTDTYLVSLMNTYGIPKTDKVITSSLLSSYVTTVSIVGYGLGYDDEQSAIVFYPAAVYSSSYYILSPYFIKEADLGQAAISGLTDYLATNPELPVPSTVDQQNALKSAIVTATESTVNYTLVSTGQFETENGSKTTNPGTTVCGSLDEYETATRKLTKTGLLTDHFDTLDPLAKGTKGGYYVTKATDKSYSMSPYVYTSYHLDETGKAVIDYFSGYSSTSEKTLFNRSSSDHDIGYFIPRSCFFFTPFSNGTFYYQYFASTNTYRLNGTSTSSAYYSTIMEIFNFMTFNILNSDTNSRFVTATKDWRAYLAITFNSNLTSFAIDAKVPFDLSDGTTVYYHTYGTLSDIGTTTIPELDGLTYDKAKA